MLYSQESGSIRSPINTEAFPLVIIIGERERANLIVQLARFFVYTSEAQRVPAGYHAFMPAVNARVHCRLNRRSCRLSTVSFHAAA